MLIPRKVSNANGLPNQDKALSQQKWGVINRILYKIILLSGKNTRQSVRQEPKIDHDAHDEDNRIRNKISSIIRDRNPPLTSRMANTFEGKGNEEALTSSYLTSSPTLDRAEPSVSRDSQSFHAELEPDEFSEDGYEAPTVFTEKINAAPSMHGNN